MLTKRFFESTRGRIATLLRVREATVAEIASQLQMTGNAVRAHLTAMERDGVVRRLAQRPGITRPSDVFGVTPEIEHLLSRAYLPLMTQFVHVFATSHSSDQVETLMREAGRSLAREVTMKRPLAGRLAMRIAGASALMNEELGALTHVERGDGYTIRGASCPLSALTRTHRAVCLAVESFLADAIGASVHECCDRTGNPRCCFEVRKA